MRLRIKHAMERVPGGMMVLPLLAGALVNTLAPGTAKFFGSFTGALFTGSLSILAVFYVCMGARISIASLPHVLRRGGAIMGTKILLGVLAGLLLGHFLGSQPIEHGWFAGLSTLAVVAALNDTNGGLYMALMTQFGSPEAAGAYSIMALESGPFLTMLTLGVAGLASFPWQTLLGSILPLILGIVLGNLDDELRDFLGSGAPLLIPFFAFAIGASLNLHRILEAGLLGVALGVAVMLVSSAALLLTERLIGGDGTAGIAAATTAGNAAAVPMLVAAANPAYAKAAGPATILVASCVITTSLCVPPLTAWWFRHTVDGKSRRREQLDA